MSEIEGRSHARRDAAPWDNPAGADGKRSETNLVAAIDCGTNSIRLLIGCEVGGRWVDHTRLMRIVRLGQGVDRTGRLDPRAIERTVTAAANYAELCRQAGVTKLRFVATSASRDASNREDFTSQIEQIFGLTPEVVAGEEEAELSFRGATAHLRDLRGPVLLIDMGGGSTEFVYSSDGSQFQALSTPLGSVRTHEKYPTFAVGAASDPASEDARAWIEATLDEVDAAIPFREVQTLVAVAGTATTVAALALNLDRYDSDRIHGYRSTCAALRRTCEEMMTMPVAERARLGFMPSGREDVIGAGAAIFSSNLERVEQRSDRSVEVVISEYDILDGIALSLL